jgi:hypothetical protein
MSKAYYRYQNLRKQYCPEHKWDEPVVEHVKRAAQEAGCSLAVLLTSNHTTRLDNGSINVRFVENFAATFSKEITEEELLRELASQFLSFEQVQGSGGSLGARGISGHSGRHIDPEVAAEVKGLVDEFLKNPMDSVPSDLQEELLTGLRKKTKSINKRFRNYDSEAARRARGRKSRAITSLSKLLAEVDPDFRELAVRALRLNQTISCC